MPEQDNVDTSEARPEPHDSVSPSKTRDERLCTHRKDDGSYCGAYKAKGIETCYLHSLTPEEREANARKASAKSAEVRSEQAEARERAVERAKYSLSDALTVTAGERVWELVNALVQRGVDGDMRAQSIIWERMEGKVTDRLEVAEVSPLDMDAKTLAAWLVEDAPMTNPQSD